MAAATAVAVLASACSGGNRREEAAPEPAARPPLDVERIDDPAFRSDGANGTLADAATDADGLAVAVGSVVDPDSGRIDPMAIETADGVTWSRTAVPESDTHAAIAAVAALPDGGFLAAGTVTTADGSDAALWRRDPQGTWGEPVMPEAFGSDGVEQPQIVAAGPAGALVAGRIDGRPVVWTSTSGDDWAQVTEPFGELFDIEAAVVGDDFVVMAAGLGPPGESSVHVFASDDGAAFVETGTLEGPGLADVNDAAFLGDRYLAVGGTRPSPAANLAPTVWASSDGRSWSAGPNLEHDPERASNLGVEADSIAVSPGGVAVLSTSGRRLWTSSDAGGSFTVAATSLPDQIERERPLAAPAGNPTLVGGDELFQLVAGGWQERSPGLVPRSRENVHIAGVTHGPAGFVAVGSVSADDPNERDGLTTRGVVWRSRDGSTWTRLPDDPDLAGGYLNGVTAYAGGYVAVGYGADGDLDRTARAFVSPDGGEWTAVDGDGLVADSSDGGALRHLGSVAAYGDGYVATGTGFDGTDIFPLVLLSDGTTLSQAQVAGPAAGSDLLTIGVCTAGSAATVVGVDQADEVHAARWSSPDGDSWQKHPSAESVSRFYACAVRDDGTTLAVGDMFEPREGAAMATFEAEAPDAPVVVDALPGPGSSGQRAEAVTWLGDHPVVVGSGADDPGRGAVIWWGIDGTSEWIRLAGDALGGPGGQQATGVASDGDTLVVVGSAPQGGAVWRASVPPP
jgi:hypothetical protein